MKAPFTISQILLRLLVSVLIASPFVVLFGMSSIIGNRNQVPPAEQAQWMSDHFLAMQNLWSFGILLYAAGFWCAFILLHRRILRPRAIILWWWALICGLLAASYVPVGTLLSLPCLITLFWKRSLYFQHDETPTAQPSATVSCHS